MQQQQQQQPRHAQQQPLLAAQPAQQPRGLLKRLSWPAQQQQPAAAAARPAAARLARLGALDWQLLAVALAMLLAAWLCSGADHGCPHAPRHTVAQLLGPNARGPGHAVSLHSAVTSVDLAAERLTLQLAMRHHGPRAAAACARGSAWLPRLAIGVAAPGGGAAPAAVLPLCGGGNSSASGEHAFTVALPLRQAAAAARPFDEWVADVRLALLPCTRRGCQRGGSPSVTWSATWANPEMTVEVARRRHGAARVLADIAGADDSGAGAGSALAEALGLDRPAQAAVFRLRFTRSPWLRIIHLTAALLQLAAIAWCCLVAAGQVVCAYVMHRFLCNTLHSGTAAAAWA